MVRSIAIEIKLLPCPKQIKSHALQTWTSRSLIQSSRSHLHFLPCKVLVFISSAFLWLVSTHHHVSQWATPGLQMIKRDDDNASTTTPHCILAWLSSFSNQCGLLVHSRHSFSLSLPSLMMLPVRNESQRSLDYPEGTTLCPSSLVAKGMCPNWCAISIPCISLTFFPRYYTIVSKFKSFYYLLDYGSSVLANLVSSLTSHQTWHTTATLP
jgi:hypothetical protein